MAFSDFINLIASSIQRKPIYETPLMEIKRRPKVQPTPEEPPIASKLSTLAQTPTKAGMLREDLEQLVESESQRQGVDPSLIKGIIRYESAWNPKAKSGSGAVGLMQLGRLAAKEVGVKDRYNPGENIRGGIAYLRRMLTRFGGDTQKALAAYNFGPTNVARGKPIPKSTWKYIRNVLNEQARLRGIAGVRERQEQVSRM